jgi:hypothetical protein
MWRRRSGIATVVLLSNKQPFKSFDYWIWIYVLSNSVNKLINYILRRGGNIQVLSCSCFSQDEIVFLVFQMVRPVAQAQADDKNTEFSPLALFNFFVSCCRENLHVMLCMSPIGEAFRNRLRQFPSLINCCTIDWFQVRIS